MKNFFKKRNLILQIAVVTALTLTISSCEKEALAPGADDADFKRGRAKAAPAPAPSDQSIAAIAIDAGFSELVGALQYVDAELDAGLVDLFLNGTDQYTVFAPGDEAFEALYGVLEIDGITDLPAELVLDVLLYHVTEGRRASNSVVPPVRPREITTLLGETFSVDKNAVITDIYGQEVNIVAADISASNGIIHVINAVLLPIGEETKSKKANAPGDESIAAIAIGAGFTELVAALTYVDEELDAGLVDLFLNGTDQYTVFAPGDDAFEALYGTLGVDAITDLPAELVLDVLLYHVTEGRRAANSVVPPVRPREITTLLGETFSVDKNAVITDIAGQSVNIVTADISASNGIIHVINAVLLPLE